MSRQYQVMNGQLVIYDNKTKMTVPAGVEWAQHGTATYEFHEMRYGLGKKTKEQLKQDVIKRIANSLYDRFNRIPERWECNGSPPCPEGQECSPADGVCLPPSDY